MTASKQLTKYDAARRALAEARSVDEVKAILNKAEALRQYARQHKDVDMERWLCEIKLRAARGIGELTAEMDKSPGARTDQPLSKGEKKLKKEALKEAGLSKDLVSRCEQIARVPEGAFERHIAEKKERGQAVSAKELIQIVGRDVRRTEKVEKISARSRPLETSKRYNMILADPPWQYRNIISESRRIENQYPTMALEDIKKLPVSDISARDAVLFLWATSPGLEEALSVLNAWGFTYRSSAVWVKPSIGPGHWFRVRHEWLLVGARGNIPVPEPSRRPDSVIEAPRGKHSEKPEAVYEMIELAYPEFSRVELFARKPRKGWDAWGNEVTP